MCVSVRECVCVCVYARGGVQKRERDRKINGFLLYLRHILLDLLFFVHARWGVTVGTLHPKIIRLIYK